MDALKQICESHYEGFQYRLGIDLHGGLLQELLAAAINGYMLVIIRSGESARLFPESMLRPQYGFSWLSHTWPGTGYCSIPSFVYMLPVTEQVIEKILLAKSLFGLRPPDFPEDLALCSSENVLWFWSMTHESEWAINPDTAPPHACRVVNEMLCM